MRVGHVLAVVALNAVGLTVLPHGDVPVASAMENLPTVLVVMDISSSMSEDDGSGRVKLDGAKSAVQTLINAVDPSTRIGLRTYPSPDESCSPGVLAIPLDKVDPTTMNARVRALSASGDTPTAAALEAAAADIRAQVQDGAPGVIVLVSDGESNCETDPCEVAETIRSQGIDLVVNTIGFRISQTGRDELSCVSGATGGKYVDVDNSDELIDELAAATTAALSMNLQFPTTIDSVSGAVQRGEASITAQVTSVGHQDALDVTLRLTFDASNAPAVLNPVRRLGNLEPGESGTVTWSFRTPADFTDSVVNFNIEAVSATSVPTARQGSISIRGKVRKQDAGPLIANRNNVLILGDSYSAGEGAGAYINGTDTKKNRCHRSDDTYGAALFDHRTNIACSGATSYEYWNRNSKNGEPSQRSQLLALAERPDLVMISFGGNDIGFEGVITKCVLLSDCDTLRTSTFEPCNRSGELARSNLIPIIILPGFCEVEGPTFKDEMTELTANLPATLKSVYRDLDRIVNGTNQDWGTGAVGGGAVVPIIVMPYSLLPPDTKAPQSGYKQYEEDALLNCPQFSESEWRFFVELTYQLNQAAKTAVDELADEGRPIYFAEDVAGAFQPNHSICDHEPFANFLDWSKTIVGKASEVAQWLYLGLLPDTSDARLYREAFHPNAIGYQAQTAALAAWSRRPEVALRPYTADPTDENALTVRSSEGTWQVPGSGATLQGSSGGTYLLDLSQFDDNTVVNVRVNSQPLPLGQFDSRDERALIRIPDALPRGHHTLIVTGVVNGELQEFRIPMNISLPKPWWASWWLPLSAVLMLLALGLVVDAWWRARRYRYEMVTVTDPYSSDPE